MNGVLGALKKLSKERMDICEVCEDYNKKNDQCLKCRCFMSYKSALPISKCPAGKWNSINIKDLTKENKNG